MVMKVYAAGEVWSTAPSAMHEGAGITTGFAPPAKTMAHLRQADPARDNPERVPQPGRGPRAAARRRGLARREQNPSRRRHPGFGESLPAQDHPRRGGLRSAVRVVAAVRRGGAAKRAFRERAREAGASCCVYAGRHLSTRRWAGLQRDLCAWLRTLEKPVGIMAGNDARDRHVLEACRMLGLRVPEDVAVIGVDNDELMCDLTNPPLSSVEQGALTLGFQAAKLLDRMMGGRKPPRLATEVPPDTGGLQPRSVASSSSKTRHIP